MHSEATQTEMVVFGAEKGLLQGHERSWAAHDLKKPELPEGFWQSIFKSQVRGGWSQGTRKDCTQFSDWLIRKWGGVTEVNIISP